MSYSYLGVNWIFSGQKWTFVSNSGFRDRAQTLTLTQNISRMRIFLAKRRWLTSCLTRITHLRKFEWILTQIFWVKACKLQKQRVNRNMDLGCPGLRPHPESSCWTWKTNFDRKILGLSFWKQKLRESLWNLWSNQTYLSFIRAFLKILWHFIILAYSRNSADKRKITKMTVESWKMVGFHF